MGKVYLGEQQISGMHILTGPTNTQDANLTDAKMLPEGYSAYGPNGKVIGTAHNIQANEVTATMSPDIIKNGDNYYAVFNITMPAGYYGGNPIAVNSKVDGSIVGDVYFDDGDIPSYVKAEALAVAEKVKNVMQDDSIVFIAISDFHHPGEQQDAWQTNINAGDLHACQALKILAYSLPRIDFACMLGDVTFGNAKTTTAIMQQQFDEINGWLGEAWKNIPQLRTVGNHDTGEYSTLVGAQFLQNNITKYNAGAVYGSDEYGYCYRDFPDRKLRVICLNSCEGETISGNNAAYCFSPAQLLWFAQTLYDVGSKADAAQWGIMVLAHYPLDLGGAYPAGNIAKAYVAGESTTQNGVTVNFNGHNAAKFIMNVHGHNHCFQYGKLHSIDNGTATEFDAWRMCTPNACFYRNNSGVVTMYGISFGDPAPYDKTAGTGKDTAFSVNVINPSEQVLYSFNYGAGIDRTISYGPTVYYMITNNLTDVNTSSAVISVESEGAYEADLTANEGYAISAVTVTMGGVDITDSAYLDGHISIPSVTGNIVITAMAVKTGYTNQIPLSTDKDGNPYNNGLGYKTGTRLNSSLNEVAISGMCCTGFIPLSGKAGDVIRIKNVTYAGTAAVYLTCFNHNGTPSKTYMQSDLESATVDGVTTITTSQDGLYSMRLSCGVIDDTSIITVNEEIVESSSPTVYRSITNSLTYVTSSNAAVSVEDGAAYTATLTAENGYTMETVVVKMGGTDITATAYNADTGVISIVSVTGNVVITANATKVMSYHNLVPTAVDSNGASAPYTDGMKLDSNGATSAYNHFVVTGFIPFDGGANHTYRIGGEGITWNEYGAIIAWYNADFTLHSNVIKYDKIGASMYWPTPIEEPNTAITFSTDAYVAPPKGAAYFRVSAKGKGENLIVTLDEKIE